MRFWGDQGDFSIFFRSELELNERRTSMVTYETFALGLDGRFESIDGYSVFEKHAIVFNSWTENKKNTFEKIEVFIVWNSRDLKIGKNSTTI